MEGTVPTQIITPEGDVITQECAKWRTGTKVGSDTGGKPLQGKEAKLFVLC
jgi:hypothetical protein